MYTQLIYNINKQPDNSHHILKIALASGWLTEVCDIT